MFFRSSPIDESECSSSPSLSFSQQGWNSPSQSSFDFEDDFSNGFCEDFTLQWLPHREISPDPLLFSSTLPNSVDTDIQQNDQVATVGSPLHNVSPSNYTLPIDHLFSLPYVSSTNFASQTSQQRPNPSSPVIRPNTYRNPHISKSQTKKVKLATPVHFTLLRMWTDDKTEVPLCGDRVSFQQGHESVVVEMRTASALALITHTQCTSLYKMKMLRKEISGIWTNPIYDEAHPPSFTKLRALHHSSTNSDVDEPYHFSSSRPKICDILIRTKSTPEVHRLLERPGINKSIDDRDVSHMGDLETRNFGVDFLFRVAKAEDVVRQTINSWNQACDKKDRERPQKKKQRSRSY
ncbi:hypothetical protein BLNAU_17009 [Blattamonas nauphoetae]|uniref:Uncharacterized protein n=1 Tax=Blattamonas nauphoetae TaxID=2049346 RepID=A0ABQ9X9Y9_9EUKA|nr:hypothetical protein BLNAU_17009 [Blattamonas nauphoetae]